MIPDFVHFIQNDHPGMANCCFINASRKCLIDTGLFSSRRAIEHAIARAGAAVSKLDLIINTHAHLDHIEGNSHFLRLAENARIGMHENAVAFIRCGEKRKTYRMVRAVVFDFPVDIILRENDAIDLGECRLTVLEMPGHSSDSIGLYDDRHKFLIGGDIVLQNDFGMINAREGYVHSIDRYMHSIRRLKDLELRCIIPGHGPMITDVGNNLDFILDRLLLFKEKPMLMVKHFMCSFIIPTCVYRKSTTRRDLEQLLHNSDWVVAIKDVVDKGKLEKQLKRYLDSLIDMGILQERGDHLTYYHFKR